MENTQEVINIGLELHIQLLGKFAVSVFKETIPDECWRSRRARNLIKLLALTPGHRLHRDQVIDTLWPNSGLAAAVNNFHQTLYTTRRVLEAAGANCLTLEDGFLSLAQADGQTLEVDLEQFEFAAEHAKGSQNSQTFQDVLALYPGDLLPDDLYEEWTIPLRELLRLTFVQILLDLAQLYETRQEYPEGIATLQQVLAVDQSHEEAHAGLMRLFALSGQRQQAVRQYQTLREVLCQELEAEPSQGTNQLYEAIQSGNLLPASPIVRTAHNLPAQVTSFIGRDKEVFALKQVILSGQTRLVTVTGAGGTGKTRLALRAVEELLDAFPHGVWFVELGAVSNPNLVTATVASALKLRESPDKSVLEVLVDYLRSKSALIILDTCEHLVELVASLVDQILHVSNQVVILATSREILGLRGEMPFLCPSLALPAPHMLKICTEMERYSALVSCEAVRLFADRTSLASPGFTISKMNAPTVAQICRRLDGIPLAIELAAARTRMLSVEKIAERLDDAFVLLTGGSRTALPRQQTLKATIDWSYNLLTPVERALLLRLSIFSGGWTLEAAEAVCAGEGTQAENLSPEEILDLLGRLADKSLILVEPGIMKETRYYTLDTIRQYAHERLLEIDGDSLMRDRHLDYFLQLAEEAKPHLRAWGMAEWLNRLEAELGNLRLALEWSLSGPIEHGLRLASALHMLWHIRSRRFEGAQWLERLLEKDSAGQPVLHRPLSKQIMRGIALIVAARLNSWYPGVYSENARNQKKEGLEIFRELGEQALRYQPFAMFCAQSSEEEAKDCLAMSRKVGDDFYTSELLRMLTHYRMDKGCIPQAMAYAQENLALKQKIGDKDGEAMALFDLGILEFLQGNLKQAVERWDDSQHCLQAVENTEMALLFSSYPVKAALVQGDYRRVLQIGEAQLAAGQEINSSLVVTTALGFIAWAAWALNEFERVPQRCEKLLGSNWEHNLPYNHGTLLYVFGRAALTKGEFDHARACLEQFAKMEILEKFMCIQALGILAAAQGRYRRAAVLLGALEQHFHWLKNVSCPAEREEYEQALVSVRSALGEELFAAAWAEGQALPLEQMKALALAVE